MGMPCWLAAAVLLSAAPAGSRHHLRTSVAPLASALGVYSEGVSGVCQQLRGGGRPEKKTKKNEEGSSEKKTKKRHEKKSSRDASDGTGKGQEVEVMHGRVEKRKGKGTEQPSGKQKAADAARESPPEGDGVKSKGGGSWQYDSEEAGEEASSSVQVGEGVMVNDPRTIRRDNKWRERRLREAGIPVPKSGTGAEQSVRPQLGARERDLYCQPTGLNPLYHRDD